MLAQVVKTVSDLYRIFYSAQYVDFRVVNKEITNPPCIICDCELSASYPLHVIYITHGTLCYWNPRCNLQELE